MLKIRKIHLIAGALFLIFAAFLLGRFVTPGNSAGHYSISTDGASRQTLPSPSPSVSPSPPQSPVPSRDLRININTATIDELCDLPGIGPVLAERIIAYRKEFGLFTSPDELKKVSGIGDKTLEAVREYISVGEDHENTGGG